MLLTLHADKNPTEFKWQVWNLHIEVARAKISIFIIVKSHPPLQHFLISFSCLKKLCVVHIGGFFSSGLSQISSPEDIAIFHMKIVFSYVGAQRLNLYLVAY